MIARRARSPFSASINLYLCSTLRERVSRSIWSSLADLLRLRHPILVTFPLFSLDLHHLIREKYALQIKFSPRFHSRNYAPREYLYDFWSEENDKKFEEGNVNNIIFTAAIWNSYWKLLEDNS